MKTDNLDISRTLPSTSMAASINGSTINVEQMVSASFHLIYTGAPVGTISIQYSNDTVTITNGVQAVVTNWITDSSLDVAVATAGQCLIKIPDVCFRFMRVIYTRTSGAGTISLCNFISKGV